MFDQELDTFKSAIDLRAYAASQGYFLDRKESWRGSSVMRHPNGDKIIIKRNAADNRYVYFSFRDERDNGTIIDWIANRQKLNLGEIRRELRPWIGQAPPPSLVFSALTPTKKDRFAVEAEYARTREITSHAYLENERAIPSSVLQDERFRSRIRANDRGDLIFPHFDADGLCGFEKRNAGYKGFSAGGTKGLWLSLEEPYDDRLVFCESAIDALSHAALQPGPRTRYASIAGKLNPEQPELIRRVIARIPVGSRIVAAMDADEVGRKLAEIVRRAFELTGRGDLRFVSEEPPVGFKDWNDVLRARPKRALPSRPEDLSVA